jgi:hypothetical protein
MTPQPAISFESGEHFSFWSVDLVSQFLFAFAIINHFETEIQQPFEQLSHIKLKLTSCLEKEKEREVVGTRRPQPAAPPRLDFNSRSVVSAVICVKE